MCGFILNGDLKENYKHHAKFGIAFVKFPQHCPTSDFYRLLKDKICKVKKEMTNFVCNLHLALDGPIVGARNVLGECSDKALVNIKEEFPCILALYHFNF